jgi:TolB-like protein
MTIRLGSRWILLALGGALLLVGASWIRWRQPRSATSSGSTLEDRTILVLPFRSQNVSDRAALDRFDSEVEAALTAANQLMVRSWDRGGLFSTEAPADEAALAAGRQRGAGYVLIGQFEQLGSRTEIAVRLLRVRDGNPVWSGTYWRGHDAMTAFPSELALDVAEALRLPSSTGGSTPRGPAHTPTP